MKESSHPTAASLRSYEEGKLSPILNAIAEGRWNSAVYLPQLLEILAGSSPSRWKERASAARALAIAPIQEEKREAVRRVLCGALEASPSASCLNDVWTSYKRVFVVVTPILLYFTSLTVDITFLGWQGGLGFALLLLSSALLSFPLAVVALPFSSLFDSARNNRARAAAAEALGTMPSSGVATHLARASNDSSPEVRFTAQRALPAALALLEPCHYGAMPPVLLASLADLLRLTASDRHFEWLSVPILRALQHVGDGTLLSPVSFAAMEGASPQIREEAAALLPLLRERAKRAQEAPFLLRPAAHSGEDDLLRPAGSSDSEPEQLLRPTAGWSESQHLPTETRAVGQKRSDCSE